MSKKLWQQISLVFLLATGFAILWGSISGWIISEFSTSQSIPYETLVVDAKGNAWIDLQRSDTPYRTLEGESIETPDHDFWLDKSHFSPPLLSNKYDEGIQNDWTQRVLYLIQQDKEIWYLVHNGKDFEAGRAYLVGYNTVTKLPVGYCVEQGFCDQLPTEDQWFQLSGQSLRNASGRYATIDNSQISLVTLNGWFAFDVEQRILRTLSNSPEFFSVSTCRTSNQKTTALIDQHNNEEARTLRSLDGTHSLFSAQKFIARNSDRLVMNNEAEEPPTEFIIPAELREKNFRFYFVSNDQALLHPNGDRWNNEEKKRLYWVNAKGEIQKTKSIAWTPRPQTDDSKESFFVAMALPVLLVFIGILSTVAPLASQNYSHPNWAEAGYFERVGLLVSEVWPGMLGLVIVSLGLAWLAIRWHRKYSRPHLAAWGVTIFLFGLPGLFGYWIYHRRPVLETCPKCGKAAPRDRAVCSHCQQTFAEPSLTGTEIFV